MPSLARSVPKPLKVPSLTRSVPKTLKVPILACSVPKPLKVPSLAHSVPKPLLLEPGCRPTPPAVKERSDWSLNFYRSICNDNIPVKLIIYIS